MPVFNVYLSTRWVNEVFCMDPDVSIEEVREDQVKNGVPADVLAITRVEL